MLSSKARRSHAADHVFTELSGVLRIDGGLGRKASYDPRAWGTKAESALAGHVTAVAQQFGSADRSVL